MAKNIIHIKNELFEVKITRKSELKCIMNYLCKDLGYSNATAHNILSMVRGVLKRMGEHGQEPNAKIKNANEL